MISPKGPVEDVSLGRGEAEPGAIAMQVAADVVLIDERKATVVARHRGLLVTGTLGVLRRDSTLEHRQGRQGVDGEAGDHLRVFVSIDMLLLDDDIAYEGLEHLGRDAHVALQQVAKLSERGMPIYPPCLADTLAGAKMGAGSSRPTVVIDTGSIHGGRSFSFSAV